MIGWKAWYTEGRTFDSSTNDWEELPDDGVLAVKVFENKKYSRYADGQDYYFMYEDTICCNNDDLKTNEKRYPGVDFKRGKWTSDEEMNKVQNEAHNTQWQ